jgi:nicotinamidase-related amidase
MGGIFVKTALLVVDMQKEFFQDEKSKDSLMSALDYINYSINIFRESKQPIIFVQDKETTDEGYQIYEEVDVQKDDSKISKYFSNSFWQTELEELLHKLKVEFLVICGFAAEYCILATYNGAMERGFEATLLQHGIASSNSNHVSFIQNICGTTSIKTMEYFLKSK